MKGRVSLKHFDSYCRYGHEYQKQKKKKQTNKKNRIKEVTNKKSLASQKP